jgi:hypothetical protein
MPDLSHGQRRFCVVDCNMSKGIGLDWAKKVLRNPSHYKFNENPNKTYATVWSDKAAKWKRLELSSDNLKYKAKTFKECVEFTRLVKE